MFGLLKNLLFLVLILGGIFLWWFLPKYNLVHNNPQLCTPLSKNIYYCGTQGDMKSFFDTIKK